MRTNGWRQSACESGTVQRRQKQERQQAEQERQRAAQERYAAELERAKERREKEIFLASQAAEIEAQKIADEAAINIENIDNALNYLNGNSPPRSLRMKTDSSGHNEIAETVGVDAEEKVQIVSLLSWISKSFNDGHIDEATKYSLKDAVIARNYLAVATSIAKRAGKGAREAKAKVKRNKKEKAEAKAEE